MLKHMFKFLSLEHSFLVSTTFFLTILLKISVYTALLFSSRRMHGNDVFVHVFCLIPDQFAQLHFGCKAVQVSFLPH